MSETNQLGLPLLLASQAQKHVTVNDALMRLDGLVQLVLVSDSVGTPPANPVDGTAFGIPTGAVNAWGGQDGKVALAQNGGWAFVTPRPGWRAFVEDRGMPAVFDGTQWQVGALTLSSHGAGVNLGMVGFDHTLSPGSSSTPTTLIPAHALVIGVTARVLTDITGSLSSWQLGNPGAAGRYGSGLGLASGSWVKGMLSAPMAFYVPTPLELLATGGDFAGGSVRIALHYMELTLPAV